MEYQYKILIFLVGCMFAWYIFSPYRLYINYQLFRGNSIHTLATNYIVIIVILSHLISFQISFLFPHTNKNREVAG